MRPVPSPSARLELSKSDKGSSVERCNLLSAVPACCVLLLLKTFTQARQKRLVVLRLCHNAVSLSSATGLAQLIGTVGSAWDIIGCELDGELGCYRAHNLTCDDTVDGDADHDAVCRLHWDAQHV